MRWNSDVLRGRQPACARHRDYHFVGEPVTADVHHERKDHGEYQDARVIIIPRDRPADADDHDKKTVMMTHVLAIFSVLVGVKVDCSAAIAQNDALCRRGLPLRRDPRRPSWKYSIGSKRKTRAMTLPGKLCMRCVRSRTLPL